MEESKQTVYICDLYDKYSSDKIISTFRINDRQWAIKEVSLNWGVPVLSSIEEDNTMPFKLYNTLEEAETFVKSIKQMEGVF